MMKIFDFTKTSRYVHTYRDYDFVCVNVVEYLMKSASYLLCEEHVLGPRKVKG